MNFKNIQYNQTYFFIASIIILAVLIIDILEIFEFGIFGIVLVGFYGFWLIKLFSKVIKWVLTKDLKCGCMEIVLTAKKEN